LLANGHGDISTVVTAAGQVNSRASYDPWGIQLSGTAQEMGFLGAYGRRADVTSGLVQMGARQYSPGLAAFLGEDPVLGLVGIGQSSDRYAYTWDDPLNLYDLDGRMPSAMAGAGPAGDYQRCLEAVTEHGTTWGDPIPFRCRAMRAPGDVPAQIDPCQAPGAPVVHTQQCFTPFGRTPVQSHRSLVGSRDDSFCSGWALGKVCAAANTVGSAVGRAFGGNSGTDYACASAGTTAGIIAGAGVGVVFGPVAGLLSDVGAANAFDAGCHLGATGHIGP
jgi:RHS repeat-associated protein